MPWIYSYKIIKDDNTLSDRTKFLKNCNRNSLRKDKNKHEKEGFLSLYSVVVKYIIPMNPFNLKKI